MPLTIQEKEEIARAAAVILQHSGVTWSDSQREELERQIERELTKIRAAQQVSEMAKRFDVSTIGQLRASLQRLAEKLERAAS